MLTLLTLLTLLSVTEGNLLFVFDNKNRGGEKRTLTGPTPKFSEIKFGNRVASAESLEGDWELYTDEWYNGRRFVIHEGQIINSLGVAQSFFFTQGSGNNKVSSARPICKYTKDPGVAKLLVFDAEGNSRQFLLDEVDLHKERWDNRIVEVYAEKGNWEIYRHPSFAGNRNIVREGNGRKLAADTSSLRPICAGKVATANERCRLAKVEIPDDFVSEDPEYKDSTVIGFASAGSCTVRDAKTLKLDDIDTVKENFRIATLGPSEEDTINWYISDEVEIDAPFRFTDSDVPIMARAKDSNNENFDHVFTSIRTKDFLSDRRLLVKSIDFDPPGAALIMAAVDRYFISTNNVPVNLHLNCSGDPKVIQSKMAITATTYPTAHVLGLHGMTRDRVCFRNDPLARCIQGIKKTYEEFVGDILGVRDDFDKCLAASRGRSNVVQSNTYNW